MCSIQALITKCIVYLEEEEAVVEETLTYEFVSVFLLSITSPWADMVKCRARRELQVFRKLMKIPQLQERLMKGEEDTNELAEFVRFCHLWCYIIISFFKGSKGHIECKV